MATTISKLGLPVLALKRPQHEVEMFNFALSNDCTLIVSNQTSKRFICYEIINEFYQNESTKWAVVMVDDSSELDTDPLVKLLNRLMPRKPNVFPSFKEAASLPHEENRNVLVVSINNFHLYTTKGYIQAIDISVVILLTTMRTLSIDHSTILKTLHGDYPRPRKIAMVEIDLRDIYDPFELKTQLDFLEEIYDLPIFMSKDVLAMNAYGEEVMVATFAYSPRNLNPIERNVWKVLNDFLDFLQDMDVAEVYQPILKIRALILLTLDVLTTYGLWSFSFILEDILHTLSVMCRNEIQVFTLLAVTACKTQFEFIQEMINSQSKKAQPIHSYVMYEILDHLTPYQALCNTGPASSEDELETYEHELGQDLSSEQKACVTNQQTKQEGKFKDCSRFERKDEIGQMSEKCQRKESNGNSVHSQKLKGVEKQVQKLKDKSQFHCIIVTNSSNFARMLSRVINYMSACNDKYSFMKSGYVTQPNSPEEEERTESVLQAVLQGMVNIVVTTKDLLSDLALTTFNVLVYFGTPSSYEEFYRMKQKIKGLAPKLMLVFNDDLSVGVKRKLQAYRDIESEIAKRVSNYLTQENKEKLLRHLGEEPPCEYTPFGDNGPSVSMVSSIQIVNRYCRRINRGDFCNLYAQFATEKKEMTENCVEFVSKLYFPLGSYCCSIVEGVPVTVTKGNDVDLKVGKLKSQMLVSMKCVKMLHSRGKIDDDLDLTEERYIDANSENVDNFELEDEGKGRAGTNKRRRAFEIKVPSFFEHNMPRANETCFLYKIMFEDPTVYKHSRSGSLETLPDPEFELGILSRKPLPKMPPFQVHTCKSDVNVRLEARDPIKIDENTLRCIRQFHHYVFRVLHKLDNRLTELSETDGYLAVPLMVNAPSPPTPSPPTPSRPTPPPSPPTSRSSTTALPDGGFQIHYEFLQEFSTFFETSTDHDVKLKSTPPCKEFSFFQNKIVRRLNESASQTHYTRYFVVKVCEDLSPSSPFCDLDVASTFAEYYNQRYGIEVALEQPLLLVQHLPTQVNFIIPRYRVETVENPRSNSKGSKTEIHLIPELCSILPLSASAWSLARYLPSVVYRLEAMLRAHEMKLKIQLETGVNKRTRSERKMHGNGGVEKCCGGNRCGEGFDGTDVGTNGDDNICGCNSSNDGQKYDDGGGDDDDGDGAGPSISIMLHALTAKSAGQQFHSEQLELLGDSCLKLEVSLELFLTDPEKDEWTLSIYRKHLVSNDTLSTEGRRLGIPGYISIAPPDLTNTSVPPGFILKGSRDVNRASLNQYVHQVLGDKHVANTVEALIAATLTSCGRNAARQFLIWLGVTQHSLDELDIFYQRLLALTFGTHTSCVVSGKRTARTMEQTTKTMEQKNPGRCSDEKDISNQLNIAGEKSYCGPETSGNLVGARDACAMSLSNFELQKNKTTCALGKPKCDHPTRPIPNFDHIERELGYCFKNKLLLLQALTHNTYPRLLSLVPETYQKMEFVGDAILDYLVMLYLCTHFPNLDHGDATDFRSALVNNFTLAFLAVQKNLHQSLRHMSPGLLDVIDQFLQFLEEQELKQGASWKTSIDAFVVGAPEMEESLVEVPKVLGDVFESVVCAVFLDSGMNLELVWKVIQPMFMPFIDYYKDNIPRSPRRLLKESFPDNDQVTFSLARLTLSRKYKSSVRVAGYGTFEAIGRTPKIAKASVARKALQHIRNVTMTNIS